MSVINKIRELREKKGMSQADLAKAAGLSMTYISLLEGGKKSPTLKSLEKISDALGIPFPLLSFLALDSKDVFPEKRKAFELVNPAIQAMVEEFFLSERN
ncbi:MAG: helix-turn-helix domain-containing protein [Bacteroidetes bacterium]|nr:helix-turn-helix domain-containing protein [Bacteroidota bacterium]